MVTAAIIDANAISRNLLTTVLANGGFEVLGDASTTSSALAGIIKLRPQIVCIDIGAPNAAGFERLDTLREGLPKAVIFLVSSALDSTTVQSAMQRGVHGFIVKPFNADTVLKVIRNAIIKLAKQHRAADSAQT